MGDVDADYPLLEKQVVDSLGMIRLISLLEDEFDVGIDDRDVVPSNFADDRRHRRARRVEALLIGDIRRASRRGRPGTHCTCKWKTLRYPEPLEKAETSGATENGAR